MVADRGARLMLQIQHNEICRNAVVQLPIPTFQPHCCLYQVYLVNGTLDQADQAAVAWCGLLFAAHFVVHHKSNQAWLYLVSISLLDAPTITLRYKPFTTPCWQVLV